MMSDLNDAITVLEQLEYQQSRLLKEALLEKHVNNPVLQQILRIALCLDRYYCKPNSNLLATSRLEPEESWEQFLDLVVKLRNREVLGSETYRVVNAFLAGCRPLYMKWYCRAISQDLRIGVGKDTVTNIWGPEFLTLGTMKKRWAFMGCKQPLPYDDVYWIKEIHYPIAVEPYSEGPRCIAFVFPASQEIACCTHFGAQLEYMDTSSAYRDQLVSLASGLCDGRPVVLDGVLLSCGNRAVFDVLHDFDESSFLSEIYLQLNDWAPLDRYHAKEFNVSWIRRKAELLRAAGATYPDQGLVIHSDNVAVVGHTMVYDSKQLDEVIRYYMETADAVMLNMPNAPHVFKETEFSTIKRC